MYNPWDYVPFIGLAINQDVTKTPIVTKMVESAVMAVAATGFAMYVGVELLKQDVSAVRESITKLDHKIEKLDEKVERIRSDIYVPRVHSSDRNQSG